MRVQGRVVRHAPDYRLERANGLGIGLAFINPVAVLILFAGVAVYYLAQELIST